jgi:hypothetical protein
MRQEKTRMTLLQRIHVRRDSELAHLLDALGDAPVLLETHDRLFRLEQEPSVSPPTPEQARAALQRSAGGLVGIDTAALQAELRAARGQAGHSRPEPTP